jgi:hypothetical protein
VISSGLDGIAQFGSSPPYTDWSPGPVVSDINYAYLGTPMSVVAGGALLTVSKNLTETVVYRGEAPDNAGVTLNPQRGSCSTDKPAIAATDAETVVAWTQAACDQAGVYVASVDPATGQPGQAVQAPQSQYTSYLGTDATAARGVDHVALTARPGGGVYLAYARQDPDGWTVLLWKVGSPEPIVAASRLTTEPSSLQISAEPASGSLWLAWETEAASGGTSQLAIRRTTADATAWSGPGRTAQFPAAGVTPSSPTWNINAGDHALDIIAGFPHGDTPTSTGALWRTTVTG